ncbi:hypothetical protein HK413_03390 [Mucilaginibacter sp. S1162]|uniref:Uncharacterized protein n=1 Tax=Mucilaginibacter humi TaxID=2732510 RepID=A0ABX1W0I3_9SPHI|nr:hypothetical protein [Mucilaginibacter humi]NNU33443.1 hypothetical protein [Mucilaginibacter humi]
MSNYRQLSESMMNDANQRVKVLEDQLHQDIAAPKAWNGETNSLVNNLDSARKQLPDVSWQALLAYINKYPQNQIAAHIMQNMNMDLNPNAYYAVYQKFSTEQKNSDEGKEIGDRLKVLIRLQPGAMAPTIAGTQPDGKPLDLKSLHKKVILVEFWKAGNYQSRLNHRGHV